jgi:heme/copper-type cytochrome/quinol oxidase subunit 2
VFIWFIMAIVLVVIVAMGYGGRKYQTKRNAHPDSTHAHHTRKHPQKSRGRGHGH